jgi:hypothetical protein
MACYQHRKTLDFSRHYTHISGSADISKECTQSGGVPHISDILPIACATEWQPGMTGTVRSSVGRR